MKYVYVILFSILSLAGILKDIAVYLTFKSNQEVIVITMCTSRDEAVNTCQGSCYLTNQLKLVNDLEQNSDKQVPPNLKENITFFYAEIITETNPSFLINDKPNGVEFISNIISSGYSEEVFQPPKYS